MFIDISTIIWVLLCISPVLHTLADPIAALPLPPPPKIPGVPDGRPIIVQPKPPIQPNPKPIIQPQKPLPVVEIPVVPKATDDDADSVFRLSTYEDTDEQALHDSFDGPQLDFFLKNLDFFSTEPGYLDNLDIYDQLKEDSPFRDNNKRPDGQPREFRIKDPSNPQRTITARFDPRAATDVCRLWSSLASYCDGAGQECGCYSSTYYVPDQWNKVAGGCARVTTRCTSGRNDDDNAWCQLGQKAASYRTFCPTDNSMLSDTKIFKFATTIDLETTTAQDQPAPVATSKANASPRPAQTTQITQTTAPRAASTMSRPSIVIIQTGGDVSPTTAAVSTTPAASLSSHSFDVIVASRVIWLLFFITVLF